MSDDESTRPILQAILQEPALQAILGDEAAALMGFQPSSSSAAAAANNADADGRRKSSLLDSETDALGSNSNNRMMENMAQQQNDNVLDEISLRHRVSDLESENARLRSLLEQHSASSAELTRKLNLRDVVVDGLRKSVVQSQSHSARSLGQPPSLGFDVVEALEEELAQAVAAQVRLREASEAQWKTKLDRVDRHLRRIIAAKEREIIQLHLQFRQTLVQLRSQHTGDIQSVFEENTRLRRMAAEAEQAALLAAEVQFNARLKAEQMRIESECEQKVQAKLVEMKYLRECLDTQESAATKLEETIDGLNRQLEAKARVLNHVLDVELPHEVSKVRAELQGYLDRESSRGQLDLAKAQMELEELQNSLEQAKAAAAQAIRDRDQAQQSLQFARNEITHKDAQIKDQNNRLNVMNQTVNALEREAEQTNMEVNLLRRMNPSGDAEDSISGGSMTFGGSGAGSPSASAEAELRRQLSVAQDDNKAMGDELRDTQDQLIKTKDDLKSASGSRTALQQRVAELEKILQDQIAQSKAALEKVEKQLEKEKARGGGADAGASGMGGRRGTRVNIVVPGNEGGGLASGGSFRGGSFRRPSSGGSGQTPTSGGKPGGKRAGDKQTAAAGSGSDTSRPPSRISDDGAASGGASGDFKAFHEGPADDGKNQQQPQQQQQQEGDGDKSNEGNGGDPFHGLGASWTQSMADFKEGRESPIHGATSGGDSSSAASPTAASPTKSVRNVAIQCMRLIAAGSGRLTPGGSQNMGRTSSSLGGGSAAAAAAGTESSSGTNTGQTLHISSTPIPGGGAAGSDGRPPTGLGQHSTTPLVPGGGKDSVLSGGSSQQQQPSSGGGGSDSLSGSRDGTPAKQGSGVGSNGDPYQQPQKPPLSDGDGDQQPSSSRHGSATGVRPGSAGGIDTGLEDVEIGPDEELANPNYYGVPSTAEERQINARLRIELVSLRFEVEYLCPPRFAAQAQAVIANMSNNVKGREQRQQQQQQQQQESAAGADGEADYLLPDHCWTPVEELEIPTGAGDVASQNDLFEQELEKRRAFHVLLFPSNPRATRFPYRCLSSPTSSPTGGEGMSSSSLIYGGGGEDPNNNNNNQSDLNNENLVPLDAYNRLTRSGACGGGEVEDGVSRRRREQQQLHTNVDIRDPYHIPEGDLDAIRREFIASAIALSHVPGGMEVLRVPISRLLRPSLGGGRALENEDGTMELPQPRIAGGGFNMNAAARRRPGSARTAPNTPRATTSVRAGWRAPDGYMGVDAVKVPGVTQFTTKATVFQPRPPGDRALHWQNAAGSSHAGQDPVTGAMPGQGRTAPAATRVPVAVNIDVAAVLADDTFAHEQSQQQAAAKERRNREFSQVMRSRLDPRYESGVEVAAARPASARIRKTIQY